MSFIPVSRVRDQIAELSRTDFSKNYLVADDQFVHVKKKSTASGRFFKLIKLQGEVEVKSDIIGAVAKIYKVLQANPEIIADTKTLNDLLVLNSHLLFYVDEFSIMEGIELYSILEKISLDTIKQALNNNYVNSENLEEVCQNLEQHLTSDEAKNWLNLAKNRLQERELVKSHPFYYRGSLVQIKNFLNESNPGTYLLSNHKTDLILHYRSSQDELKFLVIDYSKGRFTYNLPDDELLNSFDLEGLISQLQAKEVIPSSLKLIPFNEKTSPKNIAATKIQSAFRGRRTRQAVVLPQQIIPFLCEHLVDNSRATDLARGLCREINEMALNPQKYKGKSIRLEKVLLAYRFPIIDRTKWTGSEEIQLNFDCWLEMAPDGKKIKIVMIPEKNSKLGEGTYKVVHQAQVFEIPLRLKDGGGRDFRYTSKINFKVKGEDFSKQIDMKFNILSGLAIQREILEKVKGAKIASLPEDHLPHLDSKVENFEMEQEWYNADLHQAIVSSIVPLDFKGNVYRLSVLDKLQVLTDTALSLELIHKAGFVHRDVKPDNILIKIDEDNFIEGFLADFDLACKIGFSNLQADYQFWDKCSKNGLVTPFSDVYGLGMTLGELIIPGFKSSILFNPHVLLDSDSKNKFLNSLVQNHATVLNLMSDPEYCLSPTMSAHEIKAQFSLYLETHESLQPEIKRYLEQAIKDITAYEMTIDYVTNLIRTDLDVYSFLERNLSLQNLLASSEEDEKKLGIEILEKQFPLFSEVSIIKLLLEIDTTLRDLP